MKSHFTQAIKPARHTRLMYELLYRWGLTPWVAAGRAQSALVERLLDREEAWHGSTVGRTLVDLGCGTGEHSLAAAKRGWAVVGLDASAAAIDKARRAADGAGLAVRFVVGDVRRLWEVPGLEPGVSVFVDVGCYHGLRAAGRRMVAEGVGLDGTEFRKALDSFDVNMKVNRARNATKNYGKGKGG